MNPFAVPYFSCRHANAVNSVTSKSGFQQYPSSCIVCSNDQVKIVDNGLVLGKFPAVLVCCNGCGQEWFVAPEAWLAEAYSSPIANTDTGIVARSLSIHKIISSFLTIGGLSGKVLDWGSGSGLLTRLLRDDGHDCYGLEPYTSPVLAGGFTWKNQEAALAQAPYRVVFAIEVVEHLPNLQEFFSAALSNTDTLIFSTEVVERSKRGRDWWYYSRDTGQHVTFYTETSLACLARLNGCNYASSRDKRLHIITRRPVLLRLFRWLSGHRRAQIVYPVAQIVGKLRGRHSLVMSDHLAAKQALLSAHSKRSE